MSLIQRYKGCDNDWQIRLALDRKAAAQVELTVTALLWQGTTSRCRACRPLIARMREVHGQQLRIELRSPAVLPLHFDPSVRRLASGRQVCALAALVVLLAFGPAAGARTTEHHRHAHLHAMRHMLSSVGLPGMASFLTKTC